MRQPVLSQRRRASWSRRHQRSSLAAGIAVRQRRRRGAGRRRSTSPTDGGKSCFTTTPNKPPCDAGERVDVTIQTGDKVTWDFDGARHARTTSPPVPNAVDPAGRRVEGHARHPDHLRSSGTDSRHVRQGRRLPRSSARSHPGMDGTITVEGEPVETPTPTRRRRRRATTDSRPRRRRVTAAATATATPDDHTTTPAPGHASRPRTPRRRACSARASRRVAAGAQLRFWLSEPATVVDRSCAQGLEVVRHRRDRAGARGHALVRPAHQARSSAAPTRSSCAPVDAMGNKGAGGRQDAEGQVSRLPRHPPTPGRGATSCATASARSRCCAPSPPRARCAAASPR